MAIKPRDGMGNMKKMKQKKHRSTQIQSTQDSWVVTNDVYDKYAQPQNRVDLDLDPNSKRIPS